MATLEGMTPRQIRLARLAAVHDAWVDRWEPQTRPAAPVDGPSQRPETYVDLDAGRAADAEFMLATADL